jgi:hypothetical protein
VIGSPAQHHFSRSDQVTPLVVRTEPRAVSMKIMPESWRDGSARRSPHRDWRSAGLAKPLKKFMPRSGTRGIDKVRINIGA